LTQNGQNIDGTSRENREGGIATPLVDAVHTVFCTSMPHSLDSLGKKAIVSLETTVQPKKKLYDSSLENPNEYAEIRANSLVENAESIPQFFQGKPRPTTDLVHDFQVYSDENDFLILKFHLKKQAKICLKMLSENSVFQRDIDLGEVGEGFYEHWALTHKDLPSGKYKVWIDDCGTAFQPKPSFKEWVKL
jgi:hypothetical protein